MQVRSISDGIDPATSTGRLMLNLLATLAEYERELIVERVTAGIAAARQDGTRFGQPLSDPSVIADKLAIAADARAKGRTAQDAARLGGWSRASPYRHQQPAPHARAPLCSEAADGDQRWRILRLHVEDQVSPRSPETLGSACERCNVASSPEILLSRYRRCQASPLKSLGVATRSRRAEPLQQRLRGPALASESKGPETPPRKQVRRKELT